MVPVLSLWLPILLSAVFVFVVSSVIHMMFQYHESDFDKLPNEDAFRDAVRPLSIPPGDYVVPKPDSPKDRTSDAYKAKLDKGPVVFMTVFPNGQISMGASLVQWFLFAIVVSIFAAYIAGRALEPGAQYLEVFRFAGATAFAGYGLAQLQASIWYRRKWSATIKNVIDALVYALFTAGTFGWLWPG
ncbi:MAG: hypothetical protein R6X22_02620 [Gemmatimonadota bacterium]|jgi:hypothetical protein